MSHNTTLSASLTLAGHAQHLGYWVIIRTLILICLGAAIVIFLLNGTINLPFSEILTALIVLTGINLLTFVRLKNPLPVTQMEFFIHLLMDLIALSVVFYYSGGANNPFVSYFLVPICICAATLNGRYALVITILGVVSYSLLLFFHIPLPILSPHHHQADNSLNLHVLGMWLNFFISACLITYFIVKMARDLRAQEAQLNRWREDQLRDEQVMAVATLAAGTAHELGTPLSTMKLLLSELKTDYAHVPALQNDLKILQDQVNQCAATLHELVATAEQGKEGKLHDQDIRSYCLTLLERWQIMRPDVTATISISDQLPSINGQFHPTIAQAIINLLNNAADASPDNIGIHIFWDAQKINWIIDDNGPGVAAEITAHIGKSFISTKTKGLGIGLLLTQATINRYGGTVELKNRKEKGTRTYLEIPFSQPK
ncbi:ATP-binding protein [Cellvibrio sp. pealriver]|uniref:ATP-binding protein n=1 Tax=Cellvibrio sp. pealriver TaxID=1622269 RepID=UPI00066FFC3D|nr:ATP-binding protein [Cellvibrio sp. pealriver]